MGSAALVPEESEVQSEKIEVVPDFHTNVYWKLEETMSVDDLLADY